MTDTHADTRSYMVRRAIEEKAEDKAYDRLADYSMDFPEEPQEVKSKGPKMPKGKCHE